MAPASSGVADGVCVRCGAPVSQATAYLSELGPVCWPCSQALETIRAQLGRQTAERERALEKRAHRVALVHGVMWGTAIAGIAHFMPTVAAAGSGAGDRAGGGGQSVRRKRWAFAAAMVLDLGGALAFVVAAVAARGPASPLLVAACFPLSLAGLTVGARQAFPRLRSGDTAAVGGGRRRAPLLSHKFPRPRWAAPAAVGGMLAVGVAGVVYLMLHRPDPAVTTDAHAPRRMAVLPSGDRQCAGRARRTRVVSAARAWPRVGTALEALDRAWSEEAAMGAAITAVNQALAGAALPYMIEMWPGPAERPLVLSHRIVDRVPWRVGAEDRRGAPVAACR
jgi:hypothetical protein